MFMIFVFNVCEQDDHSEGAQQYRSAGNILYVCQRSQHGRKAVRPTAVCRFQPCQLQSSSHETCSHCTTERYSSVNLHSAKVEHTYLTVIYSFVFLVMFQMMDNLFFRQMQTHFLLTATADLTQFPGKSYLP